MDLFKLVMGVVLVILALTAMGFDIPQLFGMAPTEEEAPEKGCFNVDGVTVTLDAEDPFSTTNPTGSNYYKTRDGGVWSALSSVSDAGTFEASVGDEFEGWMQLNANDYYTTYVAPFKLPCKSTYTVRADTMKEGNLTFYIYDTVDKNNIAGGKVTNQSVATGDVKNLEFVIEGSYEKLWTEGVVVASWNKSTVDEVVLSQNGVKLAVASKPNQHTSRGASYSERAYAFPEIKSNAKLELTITVDIDDSAGPSSGVGANTDLNTVNFTVYDSDYFQDDFGDVGYGVEDSDDDSDVGDSNEVIGFRLE